MATRYTANPKARFGVAGIPSGYGSKSQPDVSVPAVGVVDVDRALFDLFNEQIPLVVANEGDASKRVPVVFFAGEKWALNKKLSALKDRNGTLVLPLVTAVRTSVVQDMTSDVTGRGINQQTGEIVVHRRLDRSDRGYQSLVNRLLLRGQENLALGPGEQSGLTSARVLGDLADDPVIVQGGLMKPDRTRNVYETIVVPSPQFFTAQYDVTLWAQYTTHMNQMVEGIISSFLPQANAWRLDTPKGYWFVATVEGNSYTADTNADDYSQSERVIRYRFVVKVPGYVLASRVPGAPVPLKRYVSAPSVSFETGLTADVQLGPGGALVNDPFIGADDPTLLLAPGDTRHQQRTDMRNVGDTLLYPGPAVPNPHDPALGSVPRGWPAPQYQKIDGVDSSGKKTAAFVRVRDVNRFTGETVLSPVDMGDLSIVFAGD